LPVARRSSSITGWVLLSLRQARVSRAPRAASARAVSLPMPVLAPVMT
jgi:hypothetical protein